jgi:hypothetical protein
MTTTIGDTANIPPLHQDVRFERARTRVAALHQRLELVKAEASKPRRSPTNDWVAELLRDPAAPLVAPPPPPADPAAQIAAIESAIAAAERDVSELRATLSAELASQMRPTRSARARDLVAALERALGLIQKDFTLYGRVVEAGFDPTQPLVLMGDRDAVERVLERAREAVRG